jgi:hypothetical protein
MSCKARAHLTHTNGSSRRAPEFPWWNRPRFAPQPHAGGSRIGLSTAAPHSIHGWLLILIFFEVPRQAVLNLANANVVSLKQHLSLVPINVTSLLKTIPARFCFDTLPKACRLSGASISANRILCCMSSASSTVMVSPSLMPTTFPSMICA